jgi:hypothetical protein
MGFFDSLSDLFEAATPWSTVEAEAVQRGGAGSEKTPADKDDGGEGEAEVSYRCLYYMTYWFPFGWELLRAHKAVWELAKLQMTADVDSLLST